MKDVVKGEVLIIAIEATRPDHENITNILKEFNAKLKKTKERKKTNHKTDPYKTLEFSLPKDFIDLDVIMADFGRKTLYLPTMTCDEAFALYAFNHGKTREKRLITLVNTTLNDYQIEEIPSRNDIYYFLLHLLFALRKLPIYCLEQDEFIYAVLSEDTPLTVHTFFRAFKTLEGAKKRAAEETNDTVNVWKISGRFVGYDISDFVDDADTEGGTYTHTHIYIYIYLIVQSLYYYF